MVTERLLDVSDLQPPEPLQRAVAALDDLATGQYLRLVHRRDPELLYPILDKRGHACRKRIGREGTVELLIWRRGDRAAEQICRALAGYQDAPAPKAYAPRAPDRPGLSLHQAPPIVVPLRFMLTAPGFGVLTSIVLAAAGPEAWISRWNPAVLASTHLLALGFLSMVMLGALLQLLPVVVGSPVGKSRQVSFWVHLMLTAGTLALGSGFLAERAWLFHTAMPLLAGAFGVYVVAVARAFLRAPAAGATLSAMRLAIAALCATVLLGFTLALVHANDVELTGIRKITTLHLTWGLMGWIGLLVTGVAYQVVPMFQITPSYPPWLMRWLAPVVFALLVAWSLVAYPWSAHATLAWAATLLEILLASAVVLFGVATVWLQTKRRRRLPDITLWFWRVAMLAVLCAAGLWLARHAGWGFTEESGYPLLLGLLILVGFAQSVVNGMLYKIVPFLVWLHLQSPTETRGRLSNMKQVIPRSRMWPQFWLHCAGLALLVGAVWWPRWLLYWAVLTYATSCLLLGANLIGAYVTYRRHSSDVRHDNPAQTLGADSEDD